MPEKSKTMSGRLRLLIMVLVPLAFFYIGASVWGTYSIKQKNTQYISALIDVYINDIDEKTENVNRKLGLLFLGEGEADQDVNVYLEAIRTTDNDAYRNYYISRLKAVFGTYAQEYGEGYRFFVYYPDNGWYIENHSDDISVREYAGFESMIKSYFDGDYDFKDYGSQYWKICKDQSGRACILKYYRMNHNYIGCWIRPEDLILPLQEVVGDGGGAILLYDKEKQLFAGLGEESDIVNMESGASLRSSRQSAFEKDFREMPFYIRFITAGSGMFGTVITAQMIMLGIAMIMLFIVFSSVVYLYQKVLVPVRKFSHNLEIIKTGRGELEEITSDQLEELKEANMELSFLFRQINVLETEIQQQELEKQGLHLDYLKLQIRPHFYLNCLNFIYNMIDLKKWDQAKKMTCFTADYMRYLLKDDLGFVYLWEELEHVENYMEMQKLRFETRLVYFIDQEEDTGQARIPHMLIQPFVENSIKYAMDFSYKISVTITIYREEVDGIPYTNICISDTGPGFPEDLLADLQQGGTGDLAKNAGIGIMNTVNRLRHYYGTQCVINFANGPGRGAIIDFHIPNTLESIGQREEV